MVLKRFGLHRLFNRSDAPADEVSPVQSARLKPNPGTRILIIDDSKTTQVVLAKLLTLHGYETIAAYDAESGLELVRSQRPALILMDVVMPGLTGFQATRKLRREGDAAVANTPVIIMSGNQQATEQFWSVKIGANDFMLKPFTDDDVLNRIEKILFPNAVDEVSQRSGIGTPVTE